MCTRACVCVLHTWELMYAAPESGPDPFQVGTELWAVGVRA